MKKITIIGLAMILLCSVSAFAINPDSATLHSPDNQTYATATLAAVWSWFYDDQATATTVISADSNNVARGVFVSIFGYKNNSVVCSASKNQEITVSILAKASVSKFRSFHAITASGSSTASLGSGASCWLEVE